MCVWQVAITLALSKEDREIQQLRVILDYTVGCGQASEKEESALRQRCCPPLIPALGSQMLVDLCELKSIHVYRASSRAAKAVPQKTHSSKPLTDTHIHIQNKWDWR